MHEFANSRSKVESGVANVIKWCGAGLEPQPCKNASLILTTQWKLLTGNYKQCLKINHQQKGCSSNSLVCAYTKLPSKLSGTTTDIQTVCVVKHFSPKTQTPRVRQKYQDTHSVTHIPLESYGIDTRAINIEGEREREMAEMVVQLGLDRITAYMQR